MLHPALNNLGSILVIGAHPDDIEIGCGGTLLRLIAENEPHVHWLVLSGSEARCTEARDSASFFLAQASSSTVQTECFQDSFFPANFEALKSVFNSLKERVAPDLIFTHRREDRHQDHALAAELTWHAFRDHLILEYEIPKYEGDLGQPNVYVALEKDRCREKVDAILRYFASQKPKQWFDAETLWAMLRIRGVEAGSDARYAEAFYCPKLVL